MLEKNMTGGEISDVALALTAQINARMEYFPGESRYVKKRINALKDSGESKEHRDAAKQLLRKNPIFQYLESQQELTASNVSANKLEEKSPSEAANGGVLSCFWLINFLAHPATLPVFLIIVGAAGLALGGIGLAGITTGLTMLGAQILTGVAVGATTGGGGLGLYRLFSALKEPKGEASPPVAEAKAVPF